MKATSMRSRRFFFLCVCVFLLLTNVHNLLQAQGGKAVDKIMKFPFRNSNID